MKQARTFTAPRSTADKTATGMRFFKCINATACFVVCVCVCVCVFGLLCKSQAHVQHVGQQLVDGLLEQADRHEFAVKVTGPSALPFLTFDKDDATDPG